MNNHKERAHALFSPSYAHVWLNCGQSLLNIPEESSNVDTSFRDRGTKLHEITEKAIREGISDIAMLEKLTKDPKEASIVQDVVSLVSVIRSQHQKPPTEGLEERVVLANDAWGTVDFFCFDSNKGDIVDFKFGHQTVLAAKNSQLAFYAVALAKTHNLNFVRAHIIQPDSADGVAHKYWEMNKEDLVTWHKIFAEAIKKNRKDPQFKIGYHCSACKRKATCPELNKELSTIVQSDLTDVKTPSLPAANEMSDEQLLAALRYTKLFKSWLDSIEDYALARIENGNAIPGTCPGEGRKMSAWTNEEAVIVALEERGYDPYNKRSLISPNQAKDLVGKGEFEELLGALVTKLPGKLKVKLI